MIKSRSVQLRKENPGVLALVIFGLLATIWGTSKAVWWRFGLLDREGLERVLCVGQEEGEIFRVVAKGRWKERNQQGERICEYYIEDPQDLLRWDGYWFIWFKSENGIILDYQIQKGPPVCL